MITEPFRKLIHSLAPSVVPQDFYFECAVGWFPILVDLARGLERINQLYVGVDNENCVKFTQIKEKFGTLRAYCSGGEFAHPEAYKDAEALVDAAEKASETVCEYCGDPGVTAGSRGWTITLCGPCKQEREHEC